MMDWIADLTAWLSNYTNDPDHLRLIYSGFIGLGVFAVVLAVYLLVSGVWNPLRKRVRSVKETGISNPVRADLVSAANGQSSGSTATASAFEQLGNLLVPKEGEQLSDTQAQLRYADFRSPGAVRVFYGIKLVSVIVLTLGTLAGVSLKGPTPVEELALYVLFAALCGYLMPDLVLKQLAKRRQERLRRALPDAMDLLVVCSEAGLGLVASIQRVANELNITHPDLADELALFSLQSRAGMDNRSALKDLEERTGLEDIQILVAMLLQSMRFGTSIADTLRIYADELRDKRLQRAEEKAARVSTLMLFPIIFCFMPSFMLVVIGPALIGLIDAFSKM